MSATADPTLCFELAVALLAKHATDEARRVQQELASQAGLNATAKAFVPEPSPAGVAEQRGVEGSAQNATVSALAPTRPPPEIDVFRYAMGGIQGNPAPPTPTTTLPPPLPKPLPPLKQENYRELSAIWLQLIGNIGEPKTFQLPGTSTSLIFYT